MTKDLSHFEEGGCLKTEDIQECAACGCGGNVIMCDRCPLMFHVRCMGFSGIPKVEWLCPRCVSIFQFYGHAYKIMKLGCPIVWTLWQLQGPKKFLEKDTRLRPGICFAPDGDRPIRILRFGLFMPKPRVPNENERILFFSGEHFQEMQKEVEDDISAAKCSQ